LALITAEEVIKQMELGIEERARLQEAKDKLVMAEIERIQTRKRAEEW
jgi:hypothetical protein